MPRRGSDGADEHRRANSAADLARGDQSLRAAWPLTDAGPLADAEIRVTRVRSLIAAMLP